MPSQYISEMNNPQGREAFPALSHRKPSSTRNARAVFACTSTFLVLQTSRSADLQIVNRPRNLWAHFSANYSGPSLKD